MAEVGASLQHAISRDPKDIIFLRVQGIGLLPGA